MKKRLISLIMFFALFLTSVLPTHADFASHYAWVDEDGNIIFQVLDKTRTSAKAYKTLGITITRCLKGTSVVSPAYETVAIAFNTSSATAVSNGGTTSTLFKFPESELFGRIASFYGDTDWLSDLQCLSEQPVYLVINSMMICVDYDTEGVAHQQGLYYDDGSRMGRWLFNVYANVPECCCTDCGGSVRPLVDGFTYYSDASQSELICYGKDCYVHQ